MSTDITVSLPDTLCERAQLWAQQAGRTLPDFLVDAIESSLLPLGNVPPAVETWTDKEVRAAADAFMSADDDRRLSGLLELQREDKINDDQRIELSRLMNMYQQGLLRKAAALQEAVRRGLREPPRP
jgi:hypothetical protein